MSKKSQQLNMRITQELEAQLGDLAQREKRKSTEVARIILEGAVPAALAGDDSLTSFVETIGSGYRRDSARARDKAASVEAEAYRARASRQRRKDA